MTLENLIQQVEKDRTLRNSDKISIIRFANDGIRQINEKSSFEKEEIVEEFDDEFVQIDYEIIRLNKIYITTLNDVIDTQKTSEYRFSISQDGKIYVYIYDFQYNTFIRTKDLTSLNSYKMVINFVGFKRTNIQAIQSVIDIGENFETALTYYIRSKMHIDNGDFETGNYYKSLYISELRSSSSNITPIKSEPSEYSLL